ncbi:aromatic amino acid ammonia-lyase [Chitinophaga pendula]|uniref:HAL/PAL/TAL family ammonia-lyase n=1 Tax=Chitinophaga TaxID=79328 RepID=UPI000BB0878B|nr:MULTISPECIES: aromatic amino acid ammonia-lyase [Chitinophaga]ASZ11454.1 histidine ammonia-lyase [Chitinophaga sp. MD30]UCJ05536.1 aromatic amino acid ammonia-lyase [Chitinophaga pendula]
MVVLGGETLTLNEVYRVLFGGEELTLEAGALEQVKANFEFLQQFSAKKLIYGINTGFGPMAQYRISEEDTLQLQYNLIRSHSSGAGKCMSPLLVKGLMIARLNSFMQAHSGVHPEVVHLLKDLINKNVTPCVFEHGGVGASGDLVQLAHLALVLIGEGEVIYQGETRPTAEVYASLGLQPISIHVREGLAILNGTSAMTGIGLVNLIEARKLLGWSCILSAMINETVEAFDDHLSYELNVVKKHEGQNKIAALMRDILKDSQMVRHRPDHLYKELEEEIFKDKVQEYYSLRCVPQILGPVYDTLQFGERLVVQELNSVSDNPVVDHHHKNVYHGGNFHGDYVSLEMDKIKIAITKLSMLSERQLNYLMNDKLNHKFPPFVNLGKLGFNFGMQGVQFTATSTVAENQTLSFPMYVHSIPNNNDNQDIVSMGCNAALMANRVIGNTFEVLAIQVMTMLQAVDYLQCVPRLSSFSRKIYQEVRAIFPTFIQDTPKYKDIQQIKEYLVKNEPVQLW